MSVMLQVKNLSKHFDTPRGRLHAVDNVNFSIDKGQTLGVVGESGCGKSTLGRTVMYLHEKTSGEIYFDGRDISNLKKSDLKAFRQDMQMIFQDPFSSLNPRMSVSQLIAEPLIVYNMYKGRALAREVGRLMDIVGLARRYASSYPHELDGGRRQRIGVARSLSLKPKFIVCDEPVSALDVSIQAQIINLMQDLQDEFGLTYMFITHDMSVVRHVSNYIMVMYLGVVIEYADVEEIFHYRLHPYTQALLDAVPVPEIGARKQTKLIKGEISSPIDPGNECRFAKRCPFVQDRCRIETPQLRELRPKHFVACHFAEQLEISS